ncbi:helix-turn-helix domain-containing protein [Streptomyces sp. NPDC005141]
MANSRTAAFGWVQRAQAMPAAARGRPNAVIARRLGQHVNTVRHRRNRFDAEGLAAPSDRPRPLGRPRFTPEDRLKVIAAATAVPPGTDTAWFHTNSSRPTTSTTPSPYRWTYDGTPLKAA